MNRPAEMGSIDRVGARRHSLGSSRVILALGWLLVAIGYFGPWIAHPTAALTLSGVDMGEFVKFLPGVLDGSITLWRQAFYLPPFTFVVTVALLVGSMQLRFPWPQRLLFLALSVPVSVQLLPPAWSPANLPTPEFRAQAVALVACWILLATFWLWGRLPLSIPGCVSALLALSSSGAVAWSFLAVKPAIDDVYGSAPDAGWGLYVTLGGLGLIAAASVLGAALTWKRSPVP